MQIKACCCHESEMLLPLLALHSALISSTAFLCSRHCNKPCTVYSGAVHDYMYMFIYVSITAVCPFHLGSSSDGYVPSTTTIFVAFVLILMASAVGYVVYHNRRKVITTCAILVFTENHPAMCIG